MDGAVDGSRRSAGQASRVHVETVVGLATYIQRVTRAGVRNAATTIAGAVFTSVGVVGLTEQVVHTDSPRVA